MADSVFYNDYVEDLGVGHGKCVRSNWLRNLQLKTGSLLEAMFDALGESPPNMKVQTCQSYGFGVLKIVFVHMVSLVLAGSAA